MIDVSERRACLVLSQARSTQRYRATKPTSDAALVKVIRRLSRRHPRYGYRRITVLLRREGWPVSATRVQRLWQLERLQVPRRQRKRRYLHTNEQIARRLSAAYARHVWSYDFLFDTTENGRTIKLMPVVDEYTRECLTILVGRSIRSRDVMNELKRLFDEFGAPDHIRSDNGPEFIAARLREDMKKIGVLTQYIDPGAPWQNGFVESFNATFRDELLNRELFGTVSEARVLVERWRKEYNNIRPHSSLGDATPSKYAALLHNQNNHKPALRLT